MLHRTSRVCHSAVQKRVVICIRIKTRHRIRLFFGTFIVIASEITLFITLYLYICEYINNFSDLYGLIHYLSQLSPEVNDFVFVLSILLVCGTIFNFYTIVSC